MYSLLRHVFTQGVLIMSNVGDVLRKLTNHAQDVNTSLQVQKKCVENVTEYTIYAPYLNCPYLRLGLRLWSFLRAWQLLRSDKRVTVNIHFSPGTIYHTCEYGTAHTTRTFRATLKVRTSDAEVIQQLLQFEEGIRYSYYSCCDRTPKTA